MRVDLRRVKYPTIRSMRPKGLVAAGAATLMAGLMPGMAQVAYAQETASLTVDEVIVTGTRIVRDGYEAPTPLTVVGAEQFAQQATPSVIDYMATLPSFSGNYMSNSTQNVSSGAAGTNSLNLRNLGTNRTLVLIDGQRVVPSTVTGLVDISNVPQQLIERVEVVTGGASAAYGSDAVSGVVNFILDKNFTGFKAEASGGLTSYGDDENYRVSATGGLPFADGRGHFIFSAEHSQRAGVLHGDREWNKRGWQVINNPDYTDTNGQPRRLLLPQIGPSNATPGGIIVRSFVDGVAGNDLRGAAFGQGGTPYQFNFGPLIAGSAMQGGDWEESSLHHVGAALQSKSSAQNLFSRVSYAIGDNTEISLQSSWYNGDFKTHAYPNDAYFGGMILNADHPYLPASVAERAQALGVTQIEMGHSLRDIGPVIIETGREVVRNVLTINGSFGAFGSDWNWDAYYQRGESRGSENAVNSLNLVRHELALDAVLHPDTGAIVCRSTLTDPSNGCVPYNPFGIGVNSEAALRYSSGLVSHRTQRFKQDVVAASVSGTPFSNWAGMVSVAAGLEHRRESVTGSSTDADMAGEFFAGNYRPTLGKYDVTEGFLETVVPLLNGKPFAQALDFNAALRLTDYSTSGSVETWKAGLTWSPIDDLRFRLTRSRDIRAPNLNDLFNAGLRENNQVVDHVLGQAVAVENITSGNPALKPEEADSLGIGLVFQPSFAPGFNMSVDYWEIDLGGAINTVTPQQVVDMCFRGNAAFCAAINDGQPLRATTGADRNTIRRQPFNLAKQLVRGIDIEMGYRLPMAVFDGDLGFRALASKSLENYTDNTLITPTDSSGQNQGGGPAEWRWSAAVNYSKEAFTGSLSARGISSGVYNNTFIVCTSGCPTATLDNPTINSNYIPSAYYLDLALTYQLFNRSSNDVEMEVFFNVKNIANKDPVIVVGGPSGLPFDTLSTNSGIYDTLGRVFRTGFRIKM